MTVTKYCLRALVVLSCFAAVAEPSWAQERLCDSAFEDCRAPLWQLIDRETVGIDVAFWFMQDTSYATKLINRFKAGVPVRVLVDPRANPTYKGNAEILTQLAAAGIPMRYKVGGCILHWKMMLFAGQGKLQFSGANYGAFFFTPAEPNVNYIDEAVYFTDDPAVVNSFKTKFDDLWTMTSGYSNYANITTPLARTYPTYPIDPELNFPPGTDQSFLDRTVREINRETQKIDIIMYRITNQYFTDATIAARKRGLPVRLIHEQNEYRNPARQWDAWNVDRLYMAGVEIKVRKHQGLNHEKAVLLYDQGLTIFGSSNWTGPSANSQQEHNYFTRKAWFFQWFVDHFERKWNSAAEFGDFLPLPPDVAKNLAPPDLAAGVATPEVTLKWEGGPWAHKFDIYFGADPNPPLLAANQTLGRVDDGVIESFKVTGLLPGTTYFWRVVSKTMAEQTAESPVWSFTTAGVLTPPPAPAGLAASAAAERQVNLTWSDVSTESGYRIERSADGATGWAEIATTVADATAYSDTAVAPETTYHYRVRAYGSGGTSGYSNTASATTPKPISGSGEVPPPPPAVPGNIVLYAAEALVKAGNWQVVPDATAAGGLRLWNPNAGAAKLTTALAAPAHYFELTFNAEAGKPYRLWVRGKAEANHWGNDSIFVQFSGSVDQNGNPVYRIGTTGATESNLEDASGAGLSGWGWQDNGWGVGALGPVLYFATSGPQTIRIQVREDGLSIDQIVLSPQAYLTQAPGALKNDSTILPKAQ